MKQSLALNSRRMRNINSGLGLCGADEILPEKKAFIVISLKFISEGVRGK